MTTNSLPLTLSGPDAQLLLRFLETRYDALCQYLCDEEDDLRRGEVRERADELVDAMQRQAAWATVPAHFYPRLVRNVAEAARQLALGQTVETVTMNVAMTVPRDLVPLVLATAAEQDVSLPDLPRSSGWTPHATYPARGVVTHGFELIPDEIETDPDVAAERAADGAPALRAELPIARTT